MNQSMDIERIASEVLPQRGACASLFSDLFGNKQYFLQYVSLQFSTNVMHLTQGLLLERTDNECLTFFLPVFSIYYVYCFYFHAQSYINDKILCTTCIFDINTYRNVDKVNSKTHQFDFLRFPVIVIDKRFCRKILYERQPSLLLKKIVISPFVQEI